MQTVVRRLVSSRKWLSGKPVLQFDLQTLPAVNMLESQSLVNVATSKPGFVCAGMSGKCTQQPDQIPTYITAQLQHCDLHKPTLLHFLARSNCGFPLLPSSGFAVQLQVQCSLPEFRLYSTTALGPDEQEGPDISLLSPLLQSQWDHANNAHLGNIVIKPQANTKVWWTCSQCPGGHPHKWLAKPNNRSASKGKKGAGCPFCANKKVCQHNSLHTKAPHLVHEWSEKIELSPSNFLVGSSKRAWWQCECGCEWEATINRRTGLGSGCPDCADQRRGGMHKRHPTLTESQHDMMQVWDWKLNEEAGLDPGELRCRSGKKAHWVCHKCPADQPHKWQATLNSMYKNVTHGTMGCPCCVGLQACKCNSLQSLFPEVAADWDYERNKGTPADYAAHSHKKVWWYNSHRGHVEAEIHVCTRNWTPKQQTGQVRQLQPLAHVI